MQPLYYRRRPPRRRFRDYLFPLILIAILLAGFYYGWKAVSGAFDSGKEDAVNERVFLTIENGSAKAMTVEEGEWKNVPDSIHLYQGERLKTGGDSRVTLTYPDQSLTRVDENSEVAFTTVNETAVDVQVAKGQVWTKLSENRAMARFSFQTDMLSLVPSTGSVISIQAPGSVYVVKGSVQAGVKFDDEVIRTFTVGVGQQMTVDAGVISEIQSDKTPDILLALSDTFKASDWWVWNMKKDGGIAAFEESDSSATTTDGESADGATATTETTAETGTASSLDSDVVSVTRPTPDSTTNKSSLTLEGRYDAAQVKTVYVDGQKAMLKANNAWSLSGVTLSKEGKNSLKIEAEDLKGVRQSVGTLTITLDKTAPAAPKISDPGSNGESVKIKSGEQIIKGTVSADTQAVIVNDYRLGKYLPGSKSFEYYAKTAYGNLKAGDNEFLIIAEDEAGNQSDPAKITLVLDADAAASSSDSDSAAVPAGTSSGGVSITSPNGGQSYSTSETDFNILGTTPATTAKVVVNNYTLNLYEAGSTTWKYKAGKALGNLIVGQSNTYTVKAYDSSGALLGTASITIDVKADAGTTAGSDSAASGSLSISIPTTDSTYTTSLNELVLSGSVSGADSVSLNGQKITGYNAGGAQWSTTVQLKSGANPFTVTAEKAGVKVGSDSISITYQP